MTYVAKLVVWTICFFVGVVVWFLKAGVFLLAMGVGMVIGVVHPKSLPTVKAEGNNI